MPLLAAVLVLVTACAPIPSKDEALHDRLVGKWATARRFENGHQQESIELSQDGLARIVRTYHDANGSSTTVMHGTWRVERGEFVLQSSDRANSAASGIPVERRQRIVVVTDWEWVMDEPPGVPKFRAWRYPK